jgi:hypothetical protein
MIHSFLYMFYIDVLLASIRKTIYLEGNQQPSLCFSYSPAVAGLGPEKLACQGFQVVM